MSGKVPSDSCLPLVALDAMGGDHAPSATVEGAVLAASTFPVRILLVGDSERLNAELARHPDRRDDRIEVLHAPDVVGMDEHAAASARRRPTSMQLTVDAVKDGRAVAAVSAGNSGAFFAVGLFTLGRIRGIDRPALATVFPSRSGGVVLLDIGANTDCKPGQLVDFAIMGSVYAERILGRPRPRVALLSNGEEPGKGPTVVQQAHEALRASNLHFIGNVEGKDIPFGVADVVVCDGFAGNVAIKTAEGVAEALSGWLRDELTRTLPRKLLALALQPAFRSLRKRLDYAEYGGAPVLGLRRPLIVAHGRSSPLAIANALRVARDTVDRDVVGAIAEGVEAVRTVAAGTTGAG